MNISRLLCAPPQISLTSLITTYIPMHIPMFIMMCVTLCITLYSTPEALATPAPQPCPQQVDSGFDQAYPSYPMGYSAWLLLAVALGLIVTSHLKTREAQRDDEQRENEKREQEQRGSHPSLQRKNKLKRWIGTIYGVVTLATSFGLFLILALSGTFRNDCVFCSPDRPEVTLFDEVSLVAITIMATLGLSALLRYLPYPTIRHIATMTLIPLGFLLWVILVASSNHAYLAAYC